MPSYAFKLLFENATANFAKLKVLADVLIVCVYVYVYESIDVDVNLDVLIP